MLKHDTREDARQIAASTAQNILADQVVTRINTKEIAENALNALKSLANRDGYSLTEMIAFSKPILQEVAASRGINLSHKDLDLFEYSMTGLDADSQGSGMNKSKRPGAYPAAGRSVSPISAVGTPATGSNRTSGALITKAPEKIRNSIKEILADALDQKIDPTNELPKAKSFGWADNAAITSNGSFGSFLKQTLEARRNR